MQTNVESFMPAVLRKKVKDIEANLKIIKALGTFADKLKILRFKLDLIKGSSFTELWATASEELDDIKKVDKVVSRASAKAVAAKAAAKAAVKATAGKPVARRAETKRPRRRFLRRSRLQTFWRNMASSRRRTARRRLRRMSRS
eukprot:TRINITY_DN12693_c0_g2_i2.p1 TRINITY_DN12693_c0_g2~~TRINITY_DN12693_c0_g2_i2.p1  ORF type:complete len:144 (-),score=30.74 TRINITY_DN12693_c0_g2_i2:299-730(-)